MLISEKEFEELFPGSLKAINESIENMMIFGTGAIEVTPDGIKSVNINDIREFKMKYKGIESLTKEQQDEICAIIGEWYLNWKHGLINWDERTHRLGYAKEKLKEMICGTPNEIEEDFLP